MVKSTHPKTSIIVPLSDQKATIEPSKPCHILKLYKKDNSSIVKKEKSHDKLLKENTRLKERLKALESGIVTVSRVLKEEPVPDLPEKKENGNISLVETIKTQDNPKKANKKSRKKKENLRNLLQTVEATLAHLTQALDQIQENYKPIKSSSLKDK